MTFQNAFDLGTCTVEVDAPSIGSVYSGVLGKGESSDQFTTSSGDVLQVAVTLDGQVQLNWFSGTSGSPKSGYQLSVTPTYDISSPTITLQVSGISLPFGVSGSAEAFSNQFGSTTVSLTTVGGDVWSPDPADITADMPHAGFYVYEGASV